MTKCCAVTRWSSGIFLENTDPDLVKLTLDFHWAFRVGIDPLELLDRYSSRVASLHLRNSVNGMWTEALEDGEVDYKKAATMLNAIGWRGLIVVELANEKGRKRIFHRRQPQIQPRVREENFRSVSDLLLWNRST